MCLRSLIISNSGIYSEYYEGGSIAKTVEQKSEWVNNYNTTDTFDLSSVSGSKSGSTTSDWTETVTENGKASSTADNYAYNDNDSFSSSGPGGGFHWQAYFHEINQNYRPGNPIAAPPKPNSQSHGNPGNEPSTYSSGFNAWVGENLIRPNFEDEFLANGSDAAIYGTLVASVSAGVLIGWYGGGAVFSSTTLLGATANGALWGGVEYAALGGILELGSGGLAPDMTLEGLATSVAFGGLFSGAGFLVMPMRGVADDVTRFVDDATTGRQSSSWLNFWGDLGGETIPIRNVGDNYTGNLEWLNKLGLRQGYSTHIINDDIGGSWFAKMDTQAHEGFHAVVARHLPSVWDICDARFMSIPVGAPVKYLEEVIAYSIGHGAALRFHGIPFSPIEAFGSLTRSEGIYTAMFGLGGYGVYEYFN